MYKLTGVTKNYQKGRGTVQALRGVDLVIEDGEWLAIQGRTGHGKSTLLMILGALDQPTSGIVEFDGQDLAELRETQLTAVRAASIGFIFQTFNLIPPLPSELSGGQQQQVAIARALVKGPKVLLADEPTGNLDEGTRDDIIALLESLWRDRGLTMVMVTHDSAVARRAQRLGIMKNGRLSLKQNTRSDS